MEEALFIAHFIEGKNVGDVEILVDIADSLGIDKAESEKALTSEAFDYDVNQDILEARNNGISGVPFFILNGKYAVSGAQPVEFFENALQQIYDETVVSTKDLPKNNGASCDTEGCEI